MMGRITGYLHMFGKIRVLRFFYLNYFCRSVHRIDKSKIIPYRNSVIEIEDGASIYLEDGDIEIGLDLLNGSKEETRVRLRRGSTWRSSGGCGISYGCTIEVLENALLKTQYYTMNTGSILVAARNISIGQDTMLGRDVVVYDSDYHSIYDERGEIQNYSAPVIIGNHVWIATQAMILKGSTIEEDSIIGARAVVTGTVKRGTIYCGDIRIGKEKKYGAWSRKSIGLI